MAYNSNAFKGNSADAQCSDYVNASGIGVLTGNPKLNDPKAPTLGGSAQTSSRGAQGSN